MYEASATPNLPMVPLSVYNEGKREDIELEEK